jgi:CCR4-NOT transcription complex subunit 1
MILFIQARFINIIDLDVQLARLMESGKSPSLVEFTSDLMRTAILGKPPCVPHDAFFNCKELLSMYVQEGKASERYVKISFFSHFNKISSVTVLVQELDQRFLVLTPQDLIKDGDASELRDKLGVLFSEWVRIYHHPSTSEKSHASFVMKVCIFIYL